MKKISEKNWDRNSQFHNHESYWEYQGNKLKVSVQWDSSHAYQSYARCYVWSKSLQKWELITNVPFNEINGRTYKTDVVKDLLSLAMEILE
jgi:hypothetical protein